MPRTRNPITPHARLIRRALTAIDRSLGRLVALTNGGGRVAAVERRRSRRKLTISPKRLAYLKLHGEYIGHLRNLKPRQKAQVKALRVKKGMRAAIAMAKRVAAG
jgi:hypothetical protein